MNIHHVEVTVKPAYHFSGGEQTRLLSLDVRVRNDQGTSHYQEIFSPDDLMSNFDQIMAAAARQLRAELLKYNQPQSLREHANEAMNPEDCPPPISLEEIQQRFPDTFKSMMSGSENPHPDM